MFSPLCLALPKLSTLSTSLLPMKSASLLTLTCLLGGAASVACAQDGEVRNRVVIVENVKFDYAQLLNVEPVFQVLRATRTEEHCIPVTTRTLDPVTVTAEEEKGRFGRFMDSVRNIFRRDDEDPEAREAAKLAARPPNSTLLTPDCRIVEVGREFRRPIAYDVDYVYKGTKYRSRLPEDPGNRLRLRVSVTPDLGPVSESSTAVTP